MTVILQRDKIKEKDLYFTESILKFTWGRTIFVYLVFLYRFPRFQDSNKDSGLHLSPFLLKKKSGHLNLFK